MSHPFEVGKNYRNRVGEYTVLEIDGDRMKIRYVGGGTLETKVSIQARIWENIQLEEQTAREEERLRLAREARQAARKRSSQAKRARAKPQFAGFRAEDFAAKERGIAWANRLRLGKVLAHELRQRAGGDWGSWIVRQVPEIEIGRESHYDRDKRETVAAFFVAAREDGLRYGLRLAKPDGEVQAAWPWSALLTALTEKAPLREAARQALEKHALALELYTTTEEMRYGRAARVTVQEGGLVWEQETAGQIVTLEVEWPDLIARLQETAADKRSELYLVKRLSAQEAVDAGGEIAAQIADLLADLRPLYDAAVGA